MSRIRIALVLLVVAALLVPASPAQAASTVLCTGYSSCESKSFPHGGYAAAKSTSYWNMYTGTNCTNYVAYRLVTTNGLPNKRPKSGVGNARDWGTAMSSVTDQTPAVGAVAWWGETGNHVAYIERVVSSSEIWVSESNWSGAFDWRKITTSGSGWPDGFIHFADSAAPGGLAATTLPSISGSLRFGGTLTASPGTWSPAATSFTYQWLLDGADVAGATGVTFKPRAGDVGKTVSLRVRAAKSGYSAVFATSAASAPLGPAPVSVSAKPAITGAPQVGQRLVASTGTWSRTELSFSYQWLVGGEAVSSATGPEYAPRSVDVDRTIAVEVTARRTGYAATVSRSASTAAVSPGELKLRSRPTVSGTPRIGSRLTASPGSWSPTATSTYQWYRGTQAISGATDQKFVPGFRDRGQPLRVKVTARRPGFVASSSLSSATTPVIAGRIKIAAGPTITGKPLVGSRVSVQAGSYGPAATNARRQWLRDGVPISGATGVSYRLSSRDLGRRLSVRLTLKASGYASRTVTTARLPRAQAAPKMTIATAKPGAGTVTFTIRITANGAVPTGRVTVRGGTGAARTVKLTNGRATITMKRQPAGRQTYRITYRGTSSIASTVIDKGVTVG